MGVDPKHYCSLLKSLFPPTYNSLIEFEFTHHQLLIDVHAHYANPWRRGRTDRPIGVLLFAVAIIAESGGGEIGANFC